LKGSAVGNEYETKVTADKDSFATGYQRNSAKGKGAHDSLPFFALTRDAKLYERGGEAHGIDNWLKGAPFRRTLQSAIRHLFEYMMGDRSEDHLAACRWNCAAVMTYEELISRGLLPAVLDDLPMYTRAAPTPSASAEQHKDCYNEGETAARHYAKIGLPYLDCNCPTCHDARLWRANNPGIVP
jgi:hypothetical protein